ncbi:VOC family protein [Gynuella sp.]|uniref:VOC family protein n=1 Tax=Gynuella sp. TaxID=2969146 RepID=UPI003D14D6C6
MHKSKLAGFIIDCQTPDLKGSAEFWGAALGMITETFPGEAGEKYIKLQSPETQLNIEVQTVTHPSRIHLDIETDDIEAEVSRLQRLGAKEIERIKTWVIMEAPTGHRFCVVQAEPGNTFDDTANHWQE